MKVYRTLFAALFYRGLEITCINLEFYKTIIKNYEITNLSTQHYYMEAHLYVDSAINLPNTVG